jgi:acetyl esterase/lipase
MRRIADLPFVPAGAARCVADLYLPEAAEADCLVWFFGGGLTTGDKGGPRPPVLLPEGWALVCPNYRLLDQAPFPACIEDAAAALAWAPGALAAQGVRCRRLFVGGISAGAYLSAMITLDRSWLAVHGATPDRLAGCFPLSGQMASHFAYCASQGHRPGHVLVDRFAPLWHVRSDAPPLMLIVGDNDIPCRLEENRLMAAALRTSGHRLQSCHVIAGRNHGSIGSGLGDAGDPVTRLLHSFLTEQE